MPGDGREFCVVDETAVKVRAEDGRSVANVDISPFITNLPFRSATDDFSTSDASGSTSQAAAIVEAVEAGSRLLLVDGACVRGYHAWTPSIHNCVCCKPLFSPFIPSFSFTHSRCFPSALLLFSPPLPDLFLPLQRTPARRTS